MIVELWKEQRGPCVAGLAVLLVFFAGVVWPDLFLALGVHVMHPIFLDLIAILAAGEAAHLGWDVYTNNPLDPLNRPHVYGPWWLVTGKIGLIRADAWWLGLLLALVFVVAAVAVLAPRKRKTVLMAVLMMISPAVLLGMERGNNDLIIFLLLVAAVWLVTRISHTASIMAAGLIVLATALKLYPVAALPALAAAASTRRRALILVAGAGLGCALVILSSWAVYRHAAEIAPEPITAFGYGLKLGYYFLPEIGGKRLGMLAGAVPVLLFFLWSCWHWRRDLWSMVPLSGFTGGCYVAGALCWCLCYATTINFPYRMVLLLLPARLWLQGEGSERVSAAARLQWVSVLLLLWTPLLIDLLLKMNHEERYFDGPPFSWAVIGMEQALATGVTITLALALIGWGWRRLETVES